MLRTINTNYKIWGEKDKHEREKMERQSSGRTTTPSMFGGDKKKSWNKVSVLIEVFNTSKLRS